MFEFVWFCKSCKKLKYVYLCDNSLFTSSSRFAVISCARLLKASARLLSIEFKLFMNTELSKFPNLDAMSVFNSLSIGVYMLFNIF